MSTQSLQCMTIANFALSSVQYRLLIYYNVSTRLQVITITVHTSLPSSFLIAKHAQEESPFFPASFAFSLPGSRSQTMPFHLATQWFL